MASPSTMPGATSESTHRRTYMSPENKLTLVKLCVENQGEFVRGKKTQFWATISQLLLQEANIGLKDPAGTMRGIVIGRRAQYKVQERESGTVQEDTEFTKAVDKWIEVEDLRQVERDQNKSTKTQIERDRQEAARHRFNLLQSAHHKRYYSDDADERDLESDNTGTHSEGTEIDREAISVDEEAATVQQIGHLRKRTRTQQTKDYEEIQTMSRAVEGLGDSVRMVAERLGLGGDSSGRMEDRIQQLEERIMQDMGERQELRLQQERGNKMLEAIMRKLCDGNTDLDSGSQS